MLKPHQCMPPSQGLFIQCACCNTTWLSAWSVGHGECSNMRWHACVSFVSSFWKQWSLVCLAILSYTSAEE